VGDEGDHGHTKRERPLEPGRRKAWNIMNSRERVAAAIARQPVDMVPLGFYAVDHDTVAKVLGHPTYVRNKIAIQVALWEGRRDEVAESLKVDTVEFYRKIDCADLILPKEARLLPPRDYDPEKVRKTGENQWQGADGRVFKAVPHVNEIVCVHDPRPKKDRYIEADFAERSEETEPDPSVFEVLDYVIEHLGRDRYICSPSGGVTAMTLPGGTETGLTLYALQPEVIHAANRQNVARQNQLDRWYIRPGCAGVLMEQDMAGTNGPLISPAMFRDMCQPYLAERISHVRQHVDQVVFHNCGHTIPLMDMFIDAGVDCYQSLQTTAGMEIGTLKKRFGDRLAFWGGIAVEVLIQGSPDDVRREVRQAMQRGAPGGGFILGPSHSIAMNTRYENFMALLDEFVALREKF
jgi:hypothetical protein